MNENIEQLKEEAEGKLKGFFTTRRILITALVTSGVTYLLGHANGRVTGYHRGVSVGYTRGVNEVSKMVREIRNSIEK